MSVDFERLTDYASGSEIKSMLLEWGAETVFSQFSAHHVLLLLGCLLVEMKVVVVASSLRTLSACVLSLAALLHPLEWAGPIIPILPLKLYGFLGSPVPLIVGVTSLPDHFVSDGHTVLAFPERDSVELPSDSRVQWHHVKLPMCNKLHHQIDQEISRDQGNGAGGKSAIGKRRLRRVLRRVHAHITAVAHLAYEMGTVDDCGSGSGEDSEPGEDVSTGSPYLPTLQTQERAFMRRVRRSQMLWQHCDRLGLPSRQPAAADDGESSKAQPTAQVEGKGGEGAAAGQDAGAEKQPSAANQELMEELAALKAEVHETRAKTAKINAVRAAAARATAAAEKAAAAKAVANPSGAAVLQRMGAKWRSALAMKWGGGGPSKARGGAATHRAPKSSAAPSRSAGISLGRLVLSFDRSRRGSVKSSPRRSKMQQAEQLMLA